MTSTTQNLTAIPASVIARSVRKDLKAAFPETKFKVSGTRSGWYLQEGVINIHWTDGPTADKVEAIANKYQGIRLEMDMGDHWDAEYVSNGDGTYNAVGSVYTSRSMSNETRDGILAKALELTGAADVDAFSTIVMTDNVPASLYSIFYSEDHTGIPTMYNVWDFLRWAFNSSDVKAA